MGTARRGGRLVQLLRVHLVAMSGDKLRQQIVFEAARLMYQRQEQEYARAKIRAAKSVCRQRLRPSELPTNREIRDELQRLSSVYVGVSEGPGPRDDRK